ncbi:acyltransferase domain-containing protein, partial [Streptomyces deserti]
VFADALDEVCAHLDPLLDRPLREVMFGTEADVLEQTGYAQPALFAIEVALFRLAESFGLRPEVVGGHSIGELVAAYVAGVWSLEDAARLVAARGRLMQALPEGGAMLAVQAAEEDVLPLLEGHAERVGIAAVNGPSQLVLSGDRSVLEDLAQVFSEQGRKTRWLRVSHAFHSPLMEPMLDEFRRVAQNLEYQAPSLPVVSNLTGRMASAGELRDPEYWVRHVREAVRFHDGLTTLADFGAATIVELGPDAVLTAMAHDTLTAPEAQAGLIPALRNDRPELDTFLTALAQAYVRGTAIDWTPLFAPTESRHRVDLPTYPFQHQSYWLNPQKQTQAGAGGGLVDESFWQAVEAEDLEGLTSALGVDEEAAFRSVVPALSAWRQRRHEQSLLDAWRYRPSWKPLARQAPVRHTGTWLVVAPADACDLPWTDASVRALRHSGAQAKVLLVDTERADREELRNLLTATATDEPLSGVLSLLAATSPALPFAPVPAGTTLTLALVQALGDAGIGAPLWVATRGAVSVGRSDGSVDVAGASVWGLGRVVALEYPQLWGGLVDLPAEVDEKALAGLVRV